MMPETPDELREARVVLGSELFQREVFIVAEKDNKLSKDIGDFEDIAIGNLDENAGTDLVLAGRNGAAVFDLEGKKQSQILYEFGKKEEGASKLIADAKNTMVGDMQIIDIENDGKCEYLGRGSHDGAAVFNHQGKLLWSYKEDVSIDDMTIGDVDGDGINEFVALYNGLKLLDKTGKLQWSRPEEGAYYQVEVIDTDGEGKNEIVYSDFGDCYINDWNGKLLKKVEMPFYLAQFSLCQIPDKKELNMLTVEEGFVWITDFKGNSLYKFTAPLSQFINSNWRDEFGRPMNNDVYKAKGLWVKFHKDKPAYLAVITEFAAIERSVFYIYNESGSLIYQEVLPEQCQSIALLPQTGSDTFPALLVGGSKTVWRYIAK
jgi:hypothetical protein